MYVTIDTTGIIDLNTSHVNVNLSYPIPLKQFFLNLNTSHVNVNQTPIEYWNEAFKNLNTSHVNVNLEVFPCIIKSFLKFKYISC